MRTVDGYELKPCPFCGNCNLTIEEMRNGGPAFFWVACDNPDCEAQSGYDLSKSGAVEKWNTRKEAKNV